MPQPPAHKDESAPLLPTSQASDNIVISVPRENSQNKSSNSRRLQAPIAQTCTSSIASTPSNDQHLIGTCRICFDTETSESQDPQNPLICPCQCSGSSKYVHRQCLSQWRTTNHRADAYYQCEVCKYRYQYRRLRWARVLGSHTTLVTLYLLLMTAMIAVLGFVPVLSLFPSSIGGSSGASPSPSPSPSPTPAPPGGGGSGSGSSTSHVLLLQLAWHVGNGLVMMGIMGLLGSMVLCLLSAMGYRGILPPNIFPACWLCLDVNTGPGLNWVPFAECGAAGGECGAAFVVVLVAVMLIVGIMAAAYMLYALLWVLLQLGLDKAQYMVENVQQESATGATGAASQH